MGYYMLEYFQNSDHLIKIYIQCTIQSSQTSEQFCCLLYSQSIREHIEHIMKVLQQLRELQLYLSRSKLDLFLHKTDCLGHVIDDNGIHAKLDKMWQIREWRIPQNYNEVQKFLGLVQYLALYMPDITAYTTPLSGSAQNN